jgi:hypothetical protein
VPDLEHTPFSPIRRSQWTGPALLAPRAMGRDPSNRRSKKPGERPGLYELKLVKSAAPSIPSRRRSHRGGNPSGYLRCPLLPLRTWSLGLDRQRLTNSATQFEKMMQRSNAARRTAIVELRRVTPA